MTVIVIYFFNMFVFKNRLLLLFTKVNYLFIVLVRCKGGLASLNLAVCWKQ